MKSVTFPERIVAWARHSPPARLSMAVSQADMERKPDYLRNMDIFAPLSSAERIWLLESTTMITCERGRVFYTPQDAAE
ncbi:MAG: hypothetical protein ACR2OU_01085, partial [Thermomicrobiales bacterium]